MKSGTATLGQCRHVQVWRGYTEVLAARCCTDAPRGQALSAIGRLRGDGLGHAYQIGKRARAHLAHGLTTMDLHGDFT